MKSFHFLLVCCLATSLLVVHFSFTSIEEYPSHADQTITFYKSNLTDLESNITSFDRLVQDNTSSDVEIKESYRSLRNAYKSIQFLAVYFDRQYILKFINGVPLPKLEPKVADPRILQPQGFQVIDEILGDETIDRVELRKKSAMLKKKLEVMIAGHGEIRTSDTEIFEAMRLEFISITALGMSGFDTPGTLASLQDVKVQLASLREVVALYSSKNDHRSGERLLALIDQGLDKLEDARFDTFDRFTFTRDVLNPAMDELANFQTVLKIPFLNDLIGFKRPFKNYQTNVFADDFLDPQYYLSERAGVDYSKREELGHMLFFDPVLSANNKRSCASCHNPDLGFSDGFQTSIAFDQESTLGRNSPGLLNAIYSTNFFHDARARRLEDQMEHVIFSKGEFNSNFIAIRDKLRSSEEYVSLFKDAYPEVGDKLFTKHTINSALSSYIKTLVALNSEFDLAIRNESEVDISVQNGYNLFMGKAQCGICHFAPVFNGTVPPFYDESETEVLGVPKHPDLNQFELDDDLGRNASGHVAENVWFHDRAFKTPSIRNVSLTGPYMHNGVFEDLSQVVEFYDQGGAVGRGIDLPNQTLPDSKLNLTEEEKHDLISFLNSLEDRGQASGSPETLPRFEATELSNRVVGGEY